MKLAFAKSSTVLLVIMAIAMACSSGDASTNTICEPGAEVYCRCENLDEGSQFCRDDGSGFDRCEPCFDDFEEDGDYGFPEDDGSPPVRRDAGGDAAASICGNATVEPDETCDDGNDVADDGCDACVAGGNPIGGSVCPGVSVHVWSLPVVVAGSTQNASTAHVGLECEGETGEGSPDRVYTLVPHTSGTLRISIEDAAFATALYARSDCNDVSGQFACALTSSLELQVVAGESVYLTVDGAGINRKGDYTLRLTPVP